jgi:hypothetical protein
MTETQAQPPRPVSLIAILVVLALFSSFFVVVRYVYKPSTSAAQNAAPENLGQDFTWKATSASRRGTLQEVRENERQQLSSHGWVDRDAGVVRLPIERAMDLTVQHYGGRK